MTVNIYKYYNNEIFESEVVNIDDIISDSDCSNSDCSNSNYSNMNGSGNKCDSDDVNNMVNDGELDQQNNITNNEISKLDYLNLNPNCSVELYKKNTNYEKTCFEIDTHCLIKKLEEIKKMDNDELLPNILNKNKNSKGTTLTPPPVPDLSPPSLSLSSGSLTPVSLTPPPVPDLSPPSLSPVGSLKTPSTPILPRAVLGLSETSTVNTNTSTDLQQIPNILSPLRKSSSHLNLCAFNDNNNNNNNEVVPDNNEVVPDTATSFSLQNISNNNYFPNNYLEIEDIINEVTVNKKIKGLKWCMSIESNYVKPHIPIIVFCNNRHLNEILPTDLFDDNFSCKTCDETSNNIISFFTQCFNSS